MVYVVLPLLFGCMGMHQIKQVSAINANTDVESMQKLLDSNHRYVRLATIDQIQNTELSKGMKETLTDPILEMLYNNTEWCPIRGRASKVLGEWQVQLSTEGIIEAMATCDDESRYWMLLGLESLSEVDPIAMGAIQSLTYDTDIFIRTEAAHWLETR